MTGTQQGASNEPSFEIKSLASALRHMAARVRSDADALDDLAARITAAATESPDAPARDFAPQVLARVFSTLNNSSIVGTAEAIARMVGR